MRVSNVLGLFKSQKNSEAYNNFLRQNPTLVEILRNESTPQEISQSNPALSSYLTPSMLYNLIDYITKEPEEFSKEHLRHTFIASQFFCAEQVKILQNFYRDENLLMYLLDFLLNENEINSTIAGYFAKACEVLMMVNPERFLGVLFENNLENGLFRHLYTSSISEILVKVLCYSSEFPKYLSNFVVLINQTIEMIRCQDMLVSTLASQVLEKAVLYSFDKLHSVYLNKEFLGELLKGLQNSEDFIVKGQLKVFSSILIKNGTKNEDSALQNVIQLLVSTFKSILQRFYKSLSTTCIFILDILKYACFFNNCECNSAIQQSSILEILLGLLEAHPWSSIYQNSFVSLIKVIFSNNQNLTFHLVKTLKIQNWIIRFGTNPLVAKGSTKIRTSLVSHFFVIANEMLKKSESDFSLNEALGETEGWEVFVLNVLRKQNDLENKQLGYAESKSIKENEVLTEDELKDFEIIDENNEELPNSSQRKSENYEEILKNLPEIDENKENDLIGKNLEKIEVQPLAENKLVEALQELVNGRSFEKPLVLEISFFTYVNYWRVEVPCIELEDL